MSNYNRPTSKKEFDQNFAQKKPLMNKTEAFYESSRCLFCYDAPCVSACPTGIDIPLFIKQIQTGNTTGAAKTIFNTNWLGNACGKVCPTGVLCEGACVYNHQNVKPIEIGRLQNFATAEAIDQKKELFRQGESNGKKVAIIGAGPAGIACACELRTLGYTVDVFEAKDKPSGLTVHGTAPYKITNEEALEEVHYLQEQLGFNIIYNSAIDTKENVQRLEQDYDAIFIGIGLGQTADRKLKGQDLKGVHGAVEFIERLRMNHHKEKVGEKVVVIGGGNTAMDAASEAARMGAKEVVIAYRKSREKMGGYSFEYELAVSAGAKGMFNVSPVEIMGNNRVEAVRLSKTNEDGEVILECDMVILATGQEKRTEVFELIDNLNLDEGNRVIVNEQFQTSNKKYFAGGDCVNGGAEVVNAAYDGKMAAIGIHEFL